MSYLNVQHVSHYYFNRDNYTHALNDISLSVEKGRFVALLGPSGCGKSTLLSIIAGIIQPSKGSVLLLDDDVTDQVTSIGYMLQQDYLFPWKSILNNTLTGPKIQGELTSDSVAKAEELLDEVGLKPVIHHNPDSLSGGMRQRAALARTLMTDPSLLLLDEPFSALDFQTKLKLEDFVSELLKQYNKTSVLVTHDIGEAIAMSDEIYLMKANPGEIHEHFEVPEEVRQLSPFEARKHNSYHELFDRIWEELNKLEARNEVR